MAPTISSALFIFISYFLLSGFVRETSGAISCGQVVNAISPCVNYVLNRGTLTSTCCSSVRSLNSLANTTPDRQQACTCLKNLAGNLKGLNTGRAAGLPAACKVNVGYPISTSTDCTKVK